MPELPQIIPSGEGASGTFQIPAVAGVTRLDADRPNPALNELRIQGKDVEQKVAYLGATINRQQIANQALAADADYINKASALDTSLAGIQDPAAKLKATDEGLDGIISGVLANNPGIAPHIQEQLAVRKAESMRSANMQFITDSHDQAKAGVNANYGTTLTAIANAQTPQEADNLKNNFHQYLEETSNNGFFQKGESTTIAAKFDYDVSKTLFQTLANEHPLQAMAMPLSQSGLQIDDYRNIQNEAHAKIEHDYQSAGDRNKILGTQYRQAFFDGKTNQATDDFAVAHDYITHADYRARYGKEPIDADSHGAFIHVMQAIDQFDGSPRDFARWAALNVAGNVNLKGDDRSAAIQLAHESLQYRTSDMGQAAVTNNRTTQDWAHRAYGQLWNTGIGGSAFKNAREQVQSAIASEKEQSKYAKNLDDINRIHQETVKTIKAIADPMFAPMPDSAVAPEDTTGLK